MSSTTTRKAQSSLEFVVLVSFIFFIFLGMFAVLGYRLMTLQQDVDQQAMEKLQEVLIQEIALAKKTNADYVRNITLPKNLGQQEYHLFVENDTLLALSYKNQRSFKILESGVVADICINQTYSNDAYELQLIKTGNNITLVPRPKASIDYAACLHAENLMFSPTENYCGETEKVIPGFIEFCCEVYCKCCG